MSVSSNMNLLKILIKNESFKNGLHEILSNINNGIYFCFTIMVYTFRYSNTNNKIGLCHIYNIYYTNIH
jgi:hypothetical protein